MKPSRSRSKGRLARCGLVVSGGERGQEDEAGHAEGVDHAVGAAGEDHVGVAAADQLIRFADGLRAGGTGGQAVRVGALGAEVAGQMARRSAGLLLGLVDGVQLLDAQPGEFGRVDVPVAGAARDQAHESGEVVLAFARARDKRRIACG